ncbi:hypothetical protein GCM10018785_16080 [Streptomyces longispororuber]|uniref:Uncharacterized protein n=1 Tax=Streptomyces longispororuber TaxID=68230 RepID=A0A918ZEG5_9ACTN|nr:hypothetical protein [Streptomyces longispororuber]GHE47202.1 hypothetical protein GCM10018785_16080 [Streptomyces longispororuber]
MTSVRAFVVAVLCLLTVGAAAGTAAADTGRTDTGRTDTRPTSSVEPTGDSGWGRFQG